MRRFRSRRGRRFRRTPWRRIRRVVRSVTNPIITKRVNLDGFTIAAVSAAAYDNPTTIGLVSAVENTDAELESDGTNVAQTTINSRVVSMRLNLVIHGGTAGQRFRWMLIKDPDNEGVVTALTNTFFNNSDDTPTMRELRKNTLALGVGVIPTDRLTNKLPIFVSRKALMRNGLLKENDRLELIVATSGNAAAITGTGRIWVSET